jgi:ATP-dependent Clp protease ATP-binding subunit ClpX
VLRDLAQAMLGRRAETSSQLRCSFCQRPESQVERLIAGPNVHICDRCVEFSNEILEEERRRGRV